MVYKSKRDWWLMLIVFVPLGFPIVMGIVENDYWTSLIFVAIFAAMSILFHYTRYTIQDDKLIIWTTKIDIHTITKIYKTRNPLSSPALSINRIAICYNKYDEVLVSPKEREEFIGELLKVNPNIVVNI
ncbi:MAG: PH domain-containing protein [Flavobacterium sp.]